MVLVISKLSLRFYYILLEINHLLMKQIKFHLILA